MSSLFILHFVNSFILNCDCPAPAIFFYFCFYFLKSFTVKEKTSLNVNTESFVETLYDILYKVAFIYILCKAGWLYIRVVYPNNQTIF